LACEGIVDELFDGKTVVADTEILDRLKARSDIWMDDAEVLDNLEDQMTREQLETFLSTFADVRLDEYHVFNILANSFDEKLHEDMSYLREALVEQSGNQERTTWPVLEAIFHDKRERMVMFYNLTESDLTIPTVLTQVLKYLEGDINFAKK
jgi:hypothetical protein